MSSDPMGMTGFIPIILFLLGIPFFLTLMIIIDEIRGSKRPQVKLPPTQKTIEIPAFPALIITIAIATFFLILIFLL